MIDIMLLMLTAILVENFVFSRLLVPHHIFEASDRGGTVIGMGCVVTFVMVLSNAITNLVYNLILVNLGVEYLRTIGFILVIVFLVQLIELVSRRYMPALHASLSVYLPLITTNCAVLGAALISVENGYDFIQSVAFGFAAGVGFTIAILIFEGVRARVTMASPPKAFEGMPIALVTAGLIAMVFSGFSGIDFKM